MNKWTVLAAVALLASSAWAAPRISGRGVRSVAPAADSSIARGSVFYVIGSDLGPAEAVRGEVPYPSELGGLTVAVTTPDGSATYQAYVREASAGRVTAILPSSVPAGDYDFTVARAGETSNKVRVKVSDQAFGLALQTVVAGGPVVAYARPAEGDPARVGFLSAAKPGQTIEVWATGYGPSEKPDNEFPDEANLVEGAVAVVGTKEIPVSYLGRHPGQPGYQRVVFTLPESDLSDGCAVQIYVKFGDVSTRPASLPVKVEEGAVCKFPYAVSEASLKALDEGGTVSRGDFALTQQSMSVSAGGLSINMKTETAAGSFYRHSLDSLWLGLSGSESGWMVNPNGCSVFTAEEGDADYYYTPAVALDAGPELQLTGPANLDKKLPRKENTYSADIAPAGGGIPGLPSIPGLPTIPGLPGGGGGGSAIQKGAFTLKGNGGADVGPFSVTQNIGDPIVWTNQSSIAAVVRSTPLDVLWTGGSAGEIVTVSGVSRGPAPEDAAKTVSRIFICYAPATAGKLTVPTSILGQMPASAGDERSPGSLTVQQSPVDPITTFRAPLVAGGETETSFFTFSVGGLKAPIPYR